MYATPERRMKGGSEANNISSESAGGQLLFATPTPLKNVAPSDQFLEDIRTQSQLMEASIERGYTSNRLSRIRSDRKGVAHNSGKIRFNSVSSESDAGMRRSMGSLDVGMRVKEVRKMPEPETDGRCCCFKLFGGGNDEGSKKKKKSTNRKNSSKVHDNLLNEQLSEDRASFLEEERKGD